jgi:hypothetical protein
VWLPPAYGKRQNAARGLRAVLCASLLALARLLERPVDRQAAAKSKTGKREPRLDNLLLQVELRRKRPRHPLTSSQGYLRPSCARPLGGLRISSDAWHRLSCLLRGATRPRLCAPVACTSQVLVCLLRAPPTGGTHSASRTGARSPFVCCVWERGAGSALGWGLRKAGPRVVCVCVCVGGGGGLRC